MVSNVPKRHFFVEEDLPLYELGYIFSNSSAWFETEMREKVATFDLFVRDMPKNRNFLVFGGLEEIVEAVRQWHYTKDDVQELLECGLISKKFGEYLGRFKFTGDIYAMPEGTIFFPGEPVVRVTAPIIQAMLLSSFLSTAVFSNTIFASKSIRPVIAAAGRHVIGTISHRAHGFEAAMKCARASFIAGATGGTAMPVFSKKYNLGIKEPSINVACHAYITSFPSEIEAMRDITNSFGGNATLMVDTYSFEQGLKNAIKVGLEMKAKGKRLFGIMIDSGDLGSLSVEARKSLDLAGLKETKIIAAGNLDEFKILGLVKKKAPIDSFVVVTEIANVCDDPKLETVYKLAQVTYKGKTDYCAKFSPGKETYPGTKQVFRVQKGGKFSKDMIGLDGESLGEPLLVPAVKGGEIVYAFPELREIREYVRLQLGRMPKNLLAIEKQSKYPVLLSGKVKALSKEVRKRHLKL